MLGKCSLFRNESSKTIISTVAVNRLSADKCELKSMYLLSEYHRNLKFQITI